MTCIVGINTGEKIIIAGDRMASNSFIKMEANRTKVFKKDNFIFGVCGSPRVAQLLKYKLSIPRRFMGQSMEEYIYTSFTDSVISVLDENNALEIKDGLKKFRGSFLFGFENRLYEMESNFQALEDSRGFNACGSGEYHAMASLYSTKDLEVKPEERLKKAIECANEFVVSVDNNIDMVELIYNKEKLDLLPPPPPPPAPDQSKSI